MFILHQCSQVVFPNKQQLTNEVIIMMVNKTIEWYVFLTFVEATTLLPLMTCECPKDILTPLQLL
jgi:hypothetical protein